MTKREQSLAVAVAVMLGGFVVYAIIDSVFLSPAAEADRALPALRGKIDEHTTRIGRKEYFEKRLGELAGRVFGRTEADIRENMRAYILRRARQSKINTQLDWDTSPFTGKGRSGVYKVVGWTVNARGSHESVTDFVKLLQDDPYLHKIDLLHITQIPKHRDRKILLRYVSLVLDPKVYPKGKTTTAPAGRPSVVELASADSPLRDAIVARDLFRPYVKRPVVRRRTPPKRTPPPPPPKRGPVKPPIETRLKIVSLAQYAGPPEVCLRHLDTGQLTRHKLGDKLLGGKIEMVDYRTMPHPKNPKIDSSSRVIVGVGTAFWAVELGQTLSQKYRLGPEQLPAELRPAPVVTPPGNKVSTSAVKG